MENWRQRFKNRFLTNGSWRKSYKPQDLMRFVEDELKKERQRDKLQEVLDYVQDSQSKTEILINYVLAERNVCEAMCPSQELCDRLGIDLIDKETIILFILERFFNLPEELYTKKG